MNETIIFTEKENRICEICGRILGYSIFGLAAIEAFGLCFLVLNNLYKLIFK